MKHVTQRTYTTAILLCVGLFVILVAPIFMPPPSSVLNAEHREGVGIPARISIPALRIDAAVERVELTSAGAMGVPKDIANVAWFALGPHPGDKGSAVMAGHSGWSREGDTVFHTLEQLRIGDEMAVKDVAGRVTAFVVRRTQRYNAEESVTEVFATNDGIARLNLITCEGEWDTITKSYPERLVVFAEKI